MTSVLRLPARACQRSRTAKKKSSPNLETSLALLQQMPLVTWQANRQQPGKNMELMWTTVMTTKTGGQASVSHHRRLSSNNNNNMQTLNQREAPMASGRHHRRLSSNNNNMQTLNQRGAPMAS